MQKITFILLFNFITVNLIAMQAEEQKAEFHYVMKYFHDTQLITTDHRLEPSEKMNLASSRSAEYVEWFGPYEDSLPEEFKSVTTPALLHFRTIKKIIGHLVDSKKNIEIWVPLKSGIHQTKKGLRLDLSRNWGFQRTCYLCTPWGGIEFLYRSSQKPTIEDLNLHFPGILPLITTAQSEFKCKCFTGSWHESAYKILTVDGEKLPELISIIPESHNLVCTTFIPTVWKQMEQMSNKKKKLALLAICCAQHLRLGANSPANSLSQDTLKLIASYLNDYDFAYLPEEKDQQSDAVEISRKRAAEIDDRRPAKKSKTE